MRRKIREEFQEALNKRRNLRIASGVIHGSSLAPGEAATMASEPLAKVGNNDNCAKLKRLHEAIRRVLIDMEDCCEYVYIEFSDPNPPGSWVTLAVETKDEVRIRAALNLDRPRRSVVEFDDGRSMSLAAFQRWAIDYAATGAIAAEEAETEKGYRPVGIRTYQEGFEFGQRWARSLTVKLLLRFSDWCVENEGNNHPEELWRAVYGDRYGDGSHEEEAELYKFWNIDPDAYGRISRVSQAYLEGFREAARGVADGVASNVPGIGEDR